MTRPITMVVATLIAAACADSPPVPDAAAVPEMLLPTRSSLSMIGAGVASDIEVALGDLRIRLVPMLTNQTVANRSIDPHDDEASSTLGDAANVAVIRLTLANVASALGE